MPTGLIDPMGLQSRAFPWCGSATKNFDGSAFIRAGMQCKSPSPGCCVASQVDICVLDYVGTIEWDYYIQGSGWKKLGDVSIPNINPLLIIKGLIQGWLKGTVGGVSSGSTEYNYRIIHHLETQAHGQIFQCKNNVWQKVLDLKGEKQETTPRTDTLAHQLPVIGGPKNIFFEALLKESERSFEFNTLMLNLRRSITRLENRVNDELAYYPEQYTMNHQGSATCKQMQKRLDDFNDGDPDAKEFFIRALSLNRKLF